MAFAPGGQCSLSLSVPRWAFHNKLIPRHSFMRPLARPPIHSLSLLCSFVNKNSQKHSLPPFFSLSPTLMYPPYRPREWRTAAGSGRYTSLPLPPSSSLTSSPIPPGEKVIFLLCCLSLPLPPSSLSWGGEMRGIYQPVAIQTNSKERGRSPAPAWRAGSGTDIARRLTSDAASIEGAIVLFSLTQVACATTLKIRTKAPRRLLQTDLWRQSVERDGGRSPPSLEMIFPLTAEWDRI